MGGNIFLYQTILQDTALSAVFALANTLHSVGGADIPSSWPNPGPRSGWAFPAELWADIDLILAESNLVPTLYRISPKNQ